MDKQARIYIAGHQGMVGSAILRTLTKGGFQNVILRTRQELDLRKDNPTFIVGSTQKKFHSPLINVPMKSKDFTEF